MSSWAKIASGASKKASHSPGSMMGNTLPKVKNNELGPLRARLVGLKGDNSPIGLKFERKTQTLSIGEILNMDTMELIKVSNTFRLRVTDHSTAREYEISQVAKELIQVRPGEGDNGIDIVIFKNESYDLRTFHVHIYCDYKIGFIQDSVGQVGKGKLVSHLENRRRWEKLSDDLGKQASNIAGSSTPTITAEEVYDPEALANITGSPVSSQVGLPE